MIKLNLTLAVAVGMFQGFSAAAAEVYLPTDQEVSLTFVGPLVISNPQMNQQDVLLNMWSQNRNEGCVLRLRLPKRTELRVNAGQTFVGHVDPNQPEDVIINHFYNSQDLEISCSNDHAAWNNSVPTKERLERVLPINVNLPPIQRIDAKCN